jgi:hypothetical protein
LPALAIDALHTIGTVLPLIPLNSAGTGLRCTWTTRTTATAGTATATGPTEASRASLATGQCVRFILFKIREWSTFFVEDNNMSSIAAIATISAISPSATSTAITAVATIAWRGIILTAPACAASAASAALLPALSKAANSAVSTPSAISAATVNREFAEQRFTVDQQIRRIATWFTSRPGRSRITLRALSTIASSTARQRRIITPSRALRIQAKWPACGLGEIRNRRTSPTVRTVFAVRTKTTEGSHS